MPRLVSLIMAERVITGADDSHHLINVATGLKVVAHGDAAIPPEGGTVQAPWSILTVWERETPDGAGTEARKLRFRVLDPSGAPLLERIVDLAVTRHFHRLAMNLVGLPFTVQGIYHLDVSLSDAEQGPFTTVGSYPYALEFATTDTERALAPHVP